MIGMVIGVPVFAVFYAGIRAVTNRRLEEKSLPVSTYEYLKVLNIEEDGTFTKYQNNPIKQKKMKDEAESRMGFGDSWLLLKRRSRQERSKEDEQLSADDRDAD